MNRGTTSRLLRCVLSILFLLFLQRPMIQAQPVQDSSRVIRVLTFNILHGATTKGDFDLDVIADVIRRVDPDLVALQEVDFKTRRAKGYDLVTELGWRTQMAPLFGRAMPYDGGEYGEGILSRWSFLATRNVALPYGPDKEPRAALEILTQLPSGDTIAFIGTHLDHTRNEADRIAQAQKINDAFRANAYPSILAGDLNAQPDSRPIQILREMWTPSYEDQEPEPTFPSDQPRRKIDYIMYYPADRWEVLETEVIQDPVASDHCAYLVTLHLKP